MKTEIIVGDTLDFETTVTDYPATAGWTLKHRLVPRTAGTAITMTAATASDGISYRTQIAPAVTAAYVAGEYAWNSWVEKTGARQSVESGQVTLLPDPAVTVAPMDNRSFARQMVENLETALLARKTALKFTIGDRAFEYDSREEMRLDYQFYRAEVRKEDNDARIANGQSGNGRVLVRL